MVAVHSAEIGIVKLLMGLTFDENTLDSEGSVTEEEFQQELEERPSNPVEEWVLMVKVPYSH